MPSAPLPGYHSLAVVFLPIAGRELRVAARKPSTFWVRLTTALVALVIGSMFLTLALTGVASTAPNSLGQAFFSTLTVLALVVALTSGLFFTSDCLSEEKREGTMGFLFLTDLRGYDIVLGKLLATSLRGFYALLAVFPILAAAVPMGGVTGLELWRTSLALINALLFSLAAGLFVSALSRQSQKAMGGTLLLLLVLTGGGPLADVLRVEAKGIGFQPAFSLASPAFVFSEARSWTPAAFWPALGVNSAIVAGLLGLSSLLLPRTWQEKRSSVTGKGALASRWWRFGGRRRSTRLRLKLLDANPALWLACREHWQAAVLWLVAIVALAAAVALLLVRAEPEWWMVWGYLGGLLTLFLCLAVTSRATRFFVEARKSGLLELLLATPLTAQRIVHGQWLGFLRLFALPLALYFAVSLGASVMMHQVTWRHMSAATVTTTTVTAGTTNAAPAVVVATGSDGSNIAAPTNSAGAMPPVSAATTVAPPGVWLAILMAAVTTLTALGNLAALTWFGMWMGLTSRTTNTATLLTLLYVQIIPWFVASFVVALSVPLLLLPTIFKGTSPTPGFFLIWFPLLTVGGQSIIYLGKDLFFILFARRRLLTRFRDSVAFAASPRPIRVTPPALVAAPPVIADYKFGEPQDLASIQDKVDPSPR